MLKTVSELRRQYALDGQHIVIDLTLKALTYAEYVDLLRRANALSPALCAMVQR